MFEIIKKIGIFIILAQAILYFVPGNAYLKYVKALVGVMIIAQLARPVLSLFSGEEWKEMDIQTKEFSQMLNAENQTREIEEKTEDIYNRIEEEIKEEAKKAEGREAALTEETRETGKRETVLTEETGETEETENNKQDTSDMKLKIKVEKIEIPMNP